MANWLIAAHTRLEQPGEQTLPPQANLACAVVEMDELYAFVGAKRGTKNLLYLLTIWIEKAAAS